MTQIDSTARISPGARIGQDVVVGPYCIIGPDAVIGSGCRLIANVIVSGHTEIGPRTIVHPFATLGGAPQSINYRGEPTRLVIGADNTIRESVTMNLGTAAEGGMTIIGDGGYFMTNSHVGHDCRVGNNVQFANGVALGGHCEVGDDAFLSGNVVVHQYSRIGTGAMVSGGSKVVSDVIPFVTAAGAPARLFGINTVGMRRRKFATVSISAVRAAFRELFFASGTFSARIDSVATEHAADPAVAQIIAFLRAPHRRPICHARRGAAVVGGLVGGLAVATVATVLFCVGVFALGLFMFVRRQRQIPEAL